MSPLERLNAIRDLRCLRGPQKAVLLVMALRANAIGQLWPSIACIADDAGVSVQVARRALAKLVVVGFVSRVQERAATRETTIFALVDYAIRAHAPPVSPIKNNSSPPIKNNGGTPIGFDNDPLSFLITTPYQKQQAKEIIEGDHRRGSDLPTASRPSTKPPVKSSSKKAKTSTVDPRHGEVVTHWCESFQKARGCKATFGGREAGLIKQLIAKIGHDGAKATIDRAFADSFWKDKITLVQLVSDPDKFRTANANASAAGNARPKQSAAGVTADWMKQ